MLWFCSDKYNVLKTDIYNFAGINIKVLSTSYSSKKNHASASYHQQQQQGPFFPSFSSTGFTNSFCHTVFIVSLVACSKMWLYFENFGGWRGNVHDTAHKDPEQTPAPCITWLHQHSTHLARKCLGSQASPVNPSRISWVRKVLSYGLHVVWHLEK
ncbi:hypothetical protein TNCV_193211 [Trichonephila clavipes]|nr:hypothetical protein TNCV_193211 [Trichonephila clavipes]